jgi:hypothetical protein
MSDNLMEAPRKVMGCQVMFNGSSTTICRSWIGATSGLGSVVSSVNASPPATMGRHRPAKQNESSSAFVNFHFVFGDFVPVNSKKCDAGTRHRPTGNRRPSGHCLVGAVLHLSRKHCLPKAPAIALLGWFAMHPGEMTLAFGLQKSAAGAGLPFSIGGADLFPSDLSGLGLNLILNLQRSRICLRCRCR